MLRDIYIRCFRADGELSTLHKNIVENRYITVKRYISIIYANSFILQSFQHTTKKEYNSGNHQQWCKQLLPLLRGWERIFVKQVSSQAFITCIQEVKLLPIAERYLRKEESQSKERLCRHCGKSAEFIDRFSYHCSQCDICLNLQWEV